MIRLYPFTLFPLQISVEDLWVQDNNTSNITLYFFIFLVIAISGVFLLNAFRKKASGSKDGVPKIASFFAMRRLIDDIGLNHEQAKMLKFVFKTDEVSDPQRSLVSPALLDQHFRRAYRLLDQPSDNNEETQHKLAVLFSTRNILENASIGIITSTRQIKEDTKLTISHAKEKYNVTVHSSVKNEFLTVDAPKNVLGSRIKIAKGSNVKVLFFSKTNKSYTFETSVLGFVTLHGHHVMQLAHTNNINFLSKRRFRRRQTLIACFMFLVYTEVSGKKQRLIVDKRRISGNIVDISIGGCSIKSTIPVKVGVKFKIEFIQGEDKAAAFGQVLRTNKTGIYHVIHIKFLRLTQKSMNQINAFVYDYAQE
jgi:c-di-GMP-binding flagellar brake protein YcgR